MMKSYVHETIIITKSAWKFLRNHFRLTNGYSKLRDEQLEKIWNSTKRYRNLGANPQTHPISDNEMRIEDGDFLCEFSEIKKLLRYNGFGYREDGFVVSGIDI